MFDHICSAFDICTEGEFGCFRIFVEENQSLKLILIVDMPLCEKLHAGAFYDYILKLNIYIQNTKRNTYEFY